MSSVLLAAVTPAAKASLAPIQLDSKQIRSISNLPDLGLAYRPQSWLQLHAPWLTHTFAAIFVLSAVALVVLLALQTTKQEGLSGTIGGRVDSAYRGRLGFDGQISRLTSIVAVTFVVVATIVSLSGI